MPRHRVINRRNAAPLVRRSLSVTPEAIDAANELAATLGVSLGSIVDAALRELSDQAASAVVAALAAHSHLTADERTIVERQLTKEQT